MSTLPSNTTSGFRSEYFRGSRFIAPSSAVRYDASINLPDRAAFPIPPSERAQCSAIWSGCVWPDATGAVTVRIRAEGGVALYVDGELQVCAWGPGVRNETVRLALVRNVSCHLQLVYTSNVDAAVVQLTWHGSDSTTDIPAPRIEPAPLRPQLLFHRPEALAAFEPIPEILAQIVRIDPAAAIDRVALQVNDNPAWAYGIFPESPDHWLMRGLPCADYRLTAVGLDHENREIAAATVAFAVRRDPPLSDTLRRSDICQPWRNGREFPDAALPLLRRYGLTVSGWSATGMGIEKEVLAYRRAGARLVSSTQNLILVGPADSTQGQRFLRDPALRQSLIQDPYGEIATVPWWEDCLWRCPLHPLSRQQVRIAIRDAMGANPDALQFDGALGTLCAMRHPTRCLGCLCDEVVVGFRTYLRRKYSREQLLALGVPDVETFDYRAMIQGVAPNLPAFEALYEAGRVPLLDDYQAHQHRETARLYKDQIDYARGMRGKHIPLSANLNTMLPSMIAPADAVDFLYNEVSYQAVPGENDSSASTGVVTYKLADAFGKPCAGLLRSDSNHWLRTTKGFDMLKRWIGLTYALGGNLCVPTYSIRPQDSDPEHPFDHEETVRYYQFIASHAALFDGYESVAQIGLLYSLPAIWKLWKPNYPRFVALCDALLDCNVPWNLLVAGDDHVVLRLDAQRLAALDRIVIPYDPDLDPAQASLLESFASRCVRVPLDSDAATLRTALATVRPLVSVDPPDAVWLLPRRKPDVPDAPLVVHLVNRAFDAAANRFATQRDLTVTLRREFLGALNPRTARLLTPEADPVVLTLEPFADGLRIRLPSLPVWGLLVVEP